MSCKPRLLAALGAVFAVSALLFGCGGGIPGNAVAKVGDAVISKASFEHWLTVAAYSSSGNSPAAQRPPVPDPPNYTKCIASAEQSAPPTPKGQPKPGPAVFKSQCDQAYQSLKAQVMQFLIQADWLQGEASDQGVSASDKEVQTKFQQLKQQQFPQAAQFQQFLANSGMTLQDVLFRVRLDTLSGKIKTKVTGNKGTPTNAQVVAYYNQNKARFGQPERRDLRLILVKSAGLAAKLKSQLAGGASFKTLAKKYSIDQASKAQGGALLGVVRGQQEKALDTAIFAAKKDTLLGPIKTQFGYYVFRVQKITPPSQQTLAQASPTVRQLLAQQGQQGALSKFVAQFNKKWKARTKCRSSFAVQNCSNAPKQAPSTQGTVQQTQGSGSGQQQAPPSSGSGGGQPQQAPPSSGK
ncbi:MAG: peptidylprolyl isomerase [Solirubrobacteraceae bacterium]